MKINKLGHCCLLLEANDKRILVDPGNYTIEKQKVLRNIDIILITHEHADHFHIESLKEVLEFNPSAKIVTNSSVGKLLDEESIEYKVIENGQSETFKEILIESFGDKHEKIFNEFGQVQNTGYFINNAFFFPGDAFTVPGKPVKILALPINAPWCKLQETVDYMLEVNPKVAIPVHDGNMLSLGVVERVMAFALEGKDITFVTKKSKFEGLLFEK